jgi:hypothetical protein
MKILPIVLISLVMTQCSPAFAKPDACKPVATAASTIMEIRQSGLDIYKLLHLVGADPVAKKVIKEAYESPQHLDKQLRVDETLKFSLKWYLKCYKVTQKSRTS